MDRNSPCNRQYQTSASKGDILPGTETSCLISTTESANADVRRVRLLGHRRAPNDGVAQLRDAEDLRQAGCLAEILAARIRIRSRASDRTAPVGRAAARTAATGGERRRAPCRCSPSPRPAVPALRSHRHARGRRGRSRERRRFRPAAPHRRERARPSSGRPAAVAACAKYSAPSSAEAAYAFPSASSTMRVSDSRAPFASPRASAMRASCVSANSANGT